MAIDWTSAKSFFISRWDFAKKVVVLLYLLIIAFGAAYLTCTVWLAAPKEEPLTSPTAPPDCSKVPDGAPQIARLDPDSVAIGENYVNVTIIGCNFKGETTVKFNSTVRQVGSVVNEQELVVPLQASDFAAPGNIAVSVETKTGEHVESTNKPQQPAGGSAKGTESAGGSSKTSYSNVSNLRVKPASDVKAIWRINGHCVPITLELRLILLVLFIGTFAACISGLKSLVDFIGDKRFDRSWFFYYYAQPVIGAGLALVFYFVIRAGFLAGTNADTKAVNPFGFVGVAALVGMFSDTAIRKLREIFTTLFKPEQKDTRSGKLSDFSITSNCTLPPAKKGAAYGPVTLQVTGGKPGYTWTALTTLPAGLTLDEQNGILSGTPTGDPVTDTPFTVQVKDSTGATAKKDFKLTIS